MKIFFMLSGFSLFIAYGEKDLNKVSEQKEFYIKRAITVLPLYYVVSILHAVFIGNVGNVVDIIKLAPIQILGLQSMFNTLFSISHNGGTWFISCLVLPYVLYPFLQELIKNISYKKRKILLIGLIALLIYSDYMLVWFGLSSIYSNPFFRGLEFCLGIVLASIRENDVRDTYICIGGGDNRDCFYDCIVF